MAKIIKFEASEVKLDEKNAKYVYINIPDGGLVIEDGFETFKSSTKFENVVKFDIESNKSINLYNSLSFTNSKNKDTYFTIGKLSDRPELGFNDAVCGLVNVHLWTLLSEDFLREIVTENKYKNMKVAIDMALEENDRHRFYELIEIQKGWS